MRPDIKQLKATSGRNIRDLLVLKDDNDPFYASTDRRRQLAGWFADLWQRFGFVSGVHVRRIHYRIISQASPVLLPSGEPYVNTDGCYRKLIWAVRDARYLGLVPNEHFIDQRNSETVIEQNTDDEEDAYLYLSGDCDLEMPERPKLLLSEPVIAQPYHLEIVIEKTTMDDVLAPIAEEYRLNYTSCAGDISLTRCFGLLQRAKAAARPVRILYVSDFDPHGLGMPVGCARKLEYLIRDGDLHIDLQLRPIVLTHDQCVWYGLPRTPLKETERQAAAFEARFGEGATELDALESLHPGELRRILIEEIERYYDTGLDHRIAHALVGTGGQIARINAAVTGEFEPERQNLQTELADLAGRISSYLGRVKDSLRDSAPDISEIEWPQALAGSDDPDPLFDSSRDYVEQIDRYKAHQGKPVTGKPRKAA